MIERKLARLAIIIGVAWWLARVVFSHAKHRKLDAATQAVASFKGVDGLEYQQRIREEWPLG